MAVIFGTGCNAAYMERVKDIPKIAGRGIDVDAEMGINCEWASPFLTFTGAKSLRNVPRAHLARSSTSTCLVPSMTSPLTKQAWRASIRGTSLLTRHAWQNERLSVETHFGPIPGRDISVSRL